MGKEIKVDYSIAVGMIESFTRDEDEMSSKGLEGKREKGKGKKGKKEKGT